MENNNNKFITKLKLKEKLYTLEPFELDLNSQTEDNSKSKHLIITGINGSGKTVLLKEIADNLRVTRRIGGDKVELNFNLQTRPKSVAFLETLSNVVPDAGGEYMRTNVYQQWEANEAHKLILALVFYLEGNYDETVDNEASESLEKLRERYKHLLDCFWGGLAKILQLPNNEWVRFGEFKGKRRFNYLENFDKITKDITEPPSNVNDLPSGHKASLTAFCRILIGMFARHDKDLVVDLYHIFIVDELFEAIEEFDDLSQPEKLAKFLKEDKERAESEAMEEAIKSAQDPIRQSIHACARDCAQICLRARARFSKRASDGGKNLNPALDKISELNNFCSKSALLMQEISTLIDDYYYFHHKSNPIYESSEKIVNDLNEKILFFSEEFGDKNKTAEKLLFPFVEQYRRDRKHVIDNIANAIEIPQIIIIDEPELHLHLSLQKQIMPMITEIFNGSQFIVATHSPFVVNAISNSVVYDLEKRLRVEDLSMYSYEGIVEHYFGKDMYSDEAKKMFEEYKDLYAKHEKKELDEEGIERFAEIIFELSAIPPSASKELILEFLTIEMERKSKHG